MKGSAVTEQLRLSYLDPAGLDAARHSRRSSKDRKLRAWLM